MVKTCSHEWSPFHRMSKLSADTEIYEMSQDIDFGYGGDVQRQEAAMEAEVLSLDEAELYMKLYNPFLLQLKRL